MYNIINKIDKVLNKNKVELVFKKYTPKKNKIEPFVYLETDNFVEIVIRKTEVLINAFENGSLLLLDTELETIREIQRLL